MFWYIISYVISNLNFFLFCHCSWQKSLWQFVLVWLWHNHLCRTEAYALNMRVTAISQLELCYKHNNTMLDKYQSNPIWQWLPRAGCCNFNCSKIIWTTLILICQRHGQILILSSTSFWTSSSLSGTVWLRNLENATMTREVEGHNEDNVQQALNRISGSIGNVMLLWSRNIISCSKYSI